MLSYTLVPYLSSGLLLATSRTRFYFFTHETVTSFYYFQNHLHLTCSSRPESSSKKMASSSLLAVFSTLLCILLCSHLVTADCSAHRIFFVQGSRFSCGGDGGGSTLEVEPYQLSFRATGNDGEQVPQLSLPLPASLQINIATRRNGSLNMRRSSVTIDGRRVLYRNDPDTFGDYLQVMRVIILQYRSGRCPIDNKAQKFPELAPLSGSLSTLGALFGVIDCVVEGIL